MALFAGIRIDLAHNITITIWRQVPGNVINKYPMSYESVRYFAYIVYSTAVRDGEMLLGVARGVTFSLFEAARKRQNAAKRAVARNETINLVIENLWIKHPRLFILHGNIKDAKYPGQIKQRCQN